MDIRVHGSKATEAERTAVDSVLGAPVPLSGHDARSRRDLLLPALHAVQSRFGWLTPGALNYISERLTVPPAELFGVATFYHLFSLTPQPATVIHVCDDIACRIQGAEVHCTQFEESWGPADHPVAKNGVTWRRSPCLGQCERAPATLVVQVDEAPLSYSLSKDESVIPQFGQRGLRLLRRIGRVDPNSVEA